MENGTFSEFSESAAHLNFARFYMLVSIIVLYYDWILTLPMEINRFWKPNITGPTVLFFLNRYFPLISFIPTTIAYFTDTFSSEACAKHVIPFIVGSYVISQSLIGLVLLLRIYALHQKSRTIFLIVSIAWTVEVTLGINIIKHRFAIGYCVILCYEVLVYYLTMKKTLGIRRVRSVYSMSDDGLIYLVICDKSKLLISRASNIACRHHVVDSGDISWGGNEYPDLRTVNATFTQIIPVVITSRLLLNLHQDIQEGNKLGLNRDSEWDFECVLDIHLEDPDVEKDSKRHLHPSFDHILKASYGTRTQDAFDIC
ncbi:hypothetical protein K439DRAFT_1611030 [Ramaria rubella]|nr:hypothetical protein K439DRAFT_1611030 [Ramaria rubella]